MTIAARLRSPRADVRRQAKLEAATLERLYAEVRAQSKRPWWCEPAEAA